MTEETAERHLDASTVACLGAKERSLLVHVATCASCRRLLSTEERERRAAQFAIQRRLKDVEGDPKLVAMLAALERDRREAGERVRELLARPDSWGTAATEPRNVSVHVAWQLLQVARVQEPLQALRLLDLVGEIGGGLLRRDPHLFLHREVLVNTGCARAQRLLDVGDRDGAARELRREHRRLAADLCHGRALYCQALARLRREQRRWEEALALVDRAVALFDRYGTPLEAAQAQIEQGWTLIEAGDPEEAVALLETALPLVQGVLPSEITARLGLAVALAESGGCDEASERGEPGQAPEGCGSGIARQLLADADRLTAQVAVPWTRLRLCWLGAQTARRCGWSYRALRRLGRVVTAFVAAGDDDEAARALLELMELCLERQWRRALGRRLVPGALGAVLDSPHLHRRAQAVIRLAAYALDDPSGRCAAEVLANAHRYLIESRYRPALAFEPTRSESLVHLEWDELEPPRRASICVEVGAEPENGRLPGRELEPDLRDFISWRFELLRRVRLEFTSEEPPAA